MNDKDIKNKNGDKTLSLDSELFLYETLQFNPAFSNLLQALLLFNPTTLGTLFLTPSLILTTIESSFLITSPVL